MYSLAFHPRYEDLPDVLPIFPLAGVLLLPWGRLPLNIFEPRYLNMTQDCLGQGRMIGMIQPFDQDGEIGAPKPQVHGIGCAGRVVQFAETEDGRIVLTLTGVIRFAVREELSELRGYRRVVPDYAPYRADLLVPGAFEFERQRLFDALRPYLRRREMEVNWKVLEDMPDAYLVTALSMLCPFEPQEKQALLQCETIQERATMLIALTEIGAIEGDVPPPSVRQ